MAGSKIKAAGSVFGWVQRKRAVNHVKQALLALEPTGAYGFEGLLAVVLGKLTHQTFRLAGSGSQHGKDGEAVSATSHIAFEGKLYSGYLHKNEVLSKLTEIIASPKPPDVWVLGATVEIKTQIADPLRSAAEKNAIAVMFLDWASASPVPSLAAACAAASDDVVEFLAKNISDTKIVARAKAAFDAIRAHSACQVQIDEIASGLNKPTLGAPIAIAANRTWLTQAFSDQVAKTLRNPRLLSIALSLLDNAALESLAELSVARLVFEQIRLSEREGHAVEPPEQFKRRLANHAQEIVDRIKAQQHEDKLLFQVVSGPTSQGHKLTADLLAVTQGLYFKPRPEDPSLYELADDGLAVALGLAIIKTLQAAERNSKNVTEALDDLLEPIAALDRTADIVFAALQISAADDRCTTDIRKALICAFLRLQHINVDIYPAFSAVVRQNLEAALIALEELASSTRHVASKEWLLASLRDQRRHAASWTLMSRFIDKWLRHYSLAAKLGVMSSRTHDTARKVAEETSAKHAKLAEQLAALSPSESLFLKTKMERRDELDPAVLSNDVFVLLAGMPLEPFGESLTAWSLPAHKKRTKQAPWAASVVRHVISDRDAKPVSRIPAIPEKLGFRRDARDSLAETTPLPACCELSSSLCGDS